MPLQNRVTPFGEIVAVPERGLFTGNRGILHDPATKTIMRSWALKAWLVCVLEFQGRRREVMGGRSWTELFFVDEATALAAGHRPCFHCRRAAATAFGRSFASDGAPLRAPEIDAVLHAERLQGRAKRLHPIEGDWRRLPDGTMIAAGGVSFLVLGGEARPWLAAGYAAPATPAGEPKLITPPSTVQALRRGYRPMLHPSASYGARPPLISHPRACVARTRGPSSVRAINRRVLGSAAPRENDESDADHAAVDGDA